MFCVIKYEKTVKTGKREWQLRKKQAKPHKVAPGRGSQRGKTAKFYELESAGERLYFLNFNL